MARDGARPVPPTARWQRRCTSKACGASHRMGGAVVMDKDRIEGKVDKAKGFVKDKTGELIDDPDLEARGEAERAKGEIKDRIGKAKDKVRDVVDEATE